LFTKKYIFETKVTRTKRIVQTLLALGIVLFIAFILMCIYFPIYAQKQNELSKQVFFQKSPDVIAVFTGDTGRLDLAFKKAEQHPSAKVFITGVFAKNNLAILLKNQGKLISVQEYLDEQSHHIEIEYLARNTVENGLATLNYLSKLGQQQPKVLIISSDYHIFRVGSIMQALIGSSQHVDFYYESIPIDYNKVSNIRKLIREVYKFFKTSTFLLFWERD
jgi:uncharacterized SAM-binding protein YcdF (DUF218 family)